MKPISREEFVKRFVKNVNGYGNNQEYMLHSMTLEANIIYGKLENSGTNVVLVDAGRWKGLQEHLEKFPRHKVLDEDGDGWYYDYDIGEILIWFEELRRIVND